MSRCLARTVTSGGDALLAQARQPLDVEFGDDRGRHPSRHGLTRPTVCAWGRRRRGSRPTHRDRGAGSDRWRRSATARSQRGWSTTAVKEPGAGSVVGEDPRHGVARSPGGRARGVREHTARAEGRLALVGRGRPDLVFSAPGRSRTRNLVGRSHPLYPVELRRRRLRSAEFGARPLETSVARVSWRSASPGSHAGPCMVAVAQVVRAPGCGPGGRGFKSPRSPSHPRIALSEPGGAGQTAGTCDARQPFEPAPALGVASCPDDVGLGRLSGPDQVPPNTRQPGQDGLQAEKCSEGTDERRHRSQRSQ